MRGFLLLAALSLVASAANFVAPAFCRDTRVGPDVRQDPGPAAPFTVEVPATVPEHKLVRIKVKGCPADTPLAYRVTPRAGVDLVELRHGEAVFVAPPGLYEVEVLAAVPGVGGAVVRGVTSTVRIVDSRPVGKDSAKDTPKDR